MEIETWKIAIFISVISILYGIFQITTTKKRLSETKAITLMITIYGIASSGIIVILYYIWHIHSIRKLVIHYHDKSHITQAIIFRIGIISVDLLTILVIIVTSFIFTLSFIFGQLLLHRSARSFLRNSSITNADELKNSFSWLSNHKIVITNNPKPVALSFTLVQLKKFRVKAKDWIVISDGLIQLLDSDELETVLAHEYSHTSEQDTRYSHLLFTLSSIFFFDPLLRIIVKLMEKSHEFSADRQAAILTRKPKSLAKALYKFIDYNFKNKNRLSSVGFSGKNKSILIARIEKLLEYSKEFEEFED